MNQRKPFVIGCVGGYDGWISMLIRTWIEEFFPPLHDQHTNIVHQVDLSSRNLSTYISNSLRYQKPEWDWWFIVTSIKTPEHLSELQTFDAVLFQTGTLSAEIQDVFRPRYYINSEEMLAAKRTPQEYAYDAFVNFSFEKYLPEKVGFESFFIDLFLWYDPNAVRYIFDANQYLLEQK